MKQLNKIIEDSASKLIERYMQGQYLIAQLENAGVAISSVEDFFGNFFEINLVVSMLYPKFEEDEDFLPFVLCDVIDHVCKTNVDEKPSKVLMIFNEILEFFASGFDHGCLAESSGGETIYKNKEGLQLKQSELFKKHSPLIKTASNNKTVTNRFFFQRHLPEC